MLNAHFYNPRLFIEQQIFKNELALPSPCLEFSRWTSVATLASFCTFVDTVVALIADFGMQPARNSSHNVGAIEKTTHF